MNQKELTDWFSQQNIQEVEVIVPDIAGVARGKLVPEDKFLNDSAIRLPESVFIQTVTGEFLNEPVINPNHRIRLRYFSEGSGGVSLPQIGYGLKTQKKQPLAMTKTNNTGIAIITATPSRLAQ